LSKEDFALLKEPLESGRQSPNSIAFALLIAVFIQSLFYYLTYEVAAAFTIYPNIEQIQSIHFWITVIIVSISLLYAIPAIFYRSQKIQYFLVILTSLNGVASFCYLCALFLIGEGARSTEESLLTFTLITLLLALLLWVATFIRFFILLQKGYFRKRLEKDDVREKFETKSNIPIAIIGSTVLLYIIQFVVRTANLDDLYGAFVILILFTLFYSMIFFVPHQLLILYCKFRFNSFNFDRKGFFKND
jgi:hypothetical protein